MESLINRFESVENLLLEIIKKTKNIEDIDTIFIHSLLTNKQTSNIEYMFAKWCALFKYKKNIKVYQRKDKCIFENKKEEIMNNNCFKIYIPFDEEHIYKQVEVLFDFLADNNIAHVSIVDNTVSNEVITVRVNKIEEANKINLFLKLNKDGLMLANPIAFSYNDLAFAIDRRVDYNVLASHIIYEYIVSESPALVSMEGLRNFSLNYYEDVFETGIKLDEFITKLKDLEMHNLNKGLTYYKLDQLISYKDTMKLFIKALDPNNDFMKYMEHHKLVNEENYNYLEAMELNELLFIVYGVKENYFTLKDKERILQESIISTIKKYSMDQGYKALNKYITTGYANDFTRDNNARNNMTYILTPKECVNIIKSFFKDELNIKSYVEITMNINLTKIKKELLDRAVLETIKEKGLGHTKETLEKLTKEQNIIDLKKISKNNDARRNFYKFINLDEIETLIKQTLTSYPGAIVQMKYIDLYLQRIQKNIEGV